MSRTSLYRHFNKDGALLYVGVSLSALQRLGQHSDNSAWFASISRVTIEHFESRPDALRAERNAIIKERPLHNIQHKAAAEAALRDASAQARAAAKAREDLTARIVYFKPVYTPHEVAEAMSISVSTVNAWIRNDEIGYFTMPNKNGRAIAYVSGWQLIDQIERCQSSGAARK